MDEAVVDLLNEIVGNSLTVQELKSSVKIDINLLPEECSFQPYLYACAGKLWVDARIKARRADAEVELTKSEVEALIRSKPEDYGISKITETAIVSAVQRHPLYVEAMKAYNQAQDSLDAAQIILNIFDQRRSMLNNEVQMRVSQFYQERNAISATEDEIANIRASKAVSSD